MDGLVDSAFEQAGLPQPCREYRFDPVRRWRFDYAHTTGQMYRDWIAVEIEGGVWSGGRHTRGKGFIGDMEKYNAATCAGFRVIRVTPDQVRKGDLAMWLKRVRGME